MVRCGKMINNTSVSRLKEAIEAIEKHIQELNTRDPIFGFISPKYIKCGKLNCKCIQGDKNLHGPYFYLRQEPDYSYKRYLGKKIPGNIRDRINIGKEIKKLEKHKKKINELLEKIAL